MKNRAFLTALALVWLTACGGSTPVEPVPAAEPASSSPTRDDPMDDDDGFLDPDQAPAPGYDDAELDAMDRQDLETACHAGSTAACDRLGH